MIAMHAVATSNPQRVRWVIGQCLPSTGRVRQAPGRLGALQDAGVIEDLTIDGADVTITLSPPHSWRARGDEIRSALADALQEPGSWHVETAAPSSQVAEAAEELLAGPIAALAGSHGGAITLVQVTGSQVQVQMTGACAGCPAAASTLHDGLQRELRRRFGDDVTVTAQASSAAAAVGRKLLRRRYGRKIFMTPHNAS